MGLFNRWHKLLGNESKFDSASALIVFPLSVVLFVGMTAVIYMAGGLVPIIIGNGIFIGLVVAAILKTRKGDSNV